MAIPRLPWTASFTGVWPKRGSNPCQLRELRNEAVEGMRTSCVHWTWTRIQQGQVFAGLPAGLLSASSSWGLGVRAEHPVSLDDFQEGGGRRSPEMSDTSGVSHNSDSGGGSGT